MRINDDLVIGTAGHIDHGKTALVKALTGIDTDRLPDEKKRGITIDLGFAALKLGNRSISIVDVPGHERFIRNMVAGATGIDVALLVVAADDSVMPQTLEHFEILKILGLTKGLVALTKTDLVDDDWLRLVEEDVRALVKSSFLEFAPIVATSARTGLGIDELKRELSHLAMQPVDSADSGLFRMAIDRSFSLDGQGTVVTGTTASGTVSVGDEVQLWPSGRSVRVRGLHHQGKPVESLGKGARAAVNLVGVRHIEVLRGHVLAQTGTLEPSYRLSVEVRPSADAPNPLRSRRRYRVYLGTTEVSGRLTLLEGDSADDPASGSSFAQLFLSTPVVAVHGQPFLLREESPAATVGGGRVLDPTPRRLRKKDRADLDRLQELAIADPAARLLAFVENAGFAAWNEASASRGSGLAVSEVKVVTDRLVADGRLVSFAVSAKRRQLLAESTLTSTETRVTRTLERLHRAAPRLSAIPRMRLVQALGDLGDPSLIVALLERLMSRGSVVSEGPLIRLASHQSRLSQAERRLKDEIAEAFRGSGFAPPDLEEWLARPNLKKGTVQDLLTLLEDEERLERIGPGIYLEKAAKDELIRRVSIKLADGSTLSMAELRDLLETTRKFAVPIGEYLDRIALTVREGDVRRLNVPSGLSKPAEASL